MKVYKCCSQNYKFVIIFITILQYLFKLTMEAYNTGINEVSVSIDSFEYYTKRISIYQQYNN